MKNRGLFLIYLGAALLVRLSVSWATGELTLQHDSEMTLIASHVAFDGAYASPYAAHPSGATAHSTPVFPLSLAGIFLLFGDSETGHIVRSALACLLSSLRVGLVPLLMLEVGLSLTSAHLAGAIGVLYIAALTTEIGGETDGPHVALCLLFLVWMSIRIWRGGRWPTRAPWGFFVFCGFAMLVNPSILTVIAGVLAVGFLACAAEHRSRYLVRCLQLGAVVFLCLLPWGLRNQKELGSFILTRSNFGLELWISNGPDRSFDLPHNYESFHPYKNQTEARKVAALGERAYNREKVTESLAWIRANPGEFASLTARRFLAWWFPPGGLAIIVAKAGLTVLAFAGLWMLRRQSTILFILIAVTWATYPEIYYIIQWSSRMRFPMDWQLVLCASVALAGMWEFAMKKQAARDTRVLGDELQDQA